LLGLGELFLKIELLFYPVSMCAVLFPATLCFKSIVWYNWNEMEEGKKVWASQKIIIITMQIYKRQYQIINNNTTMAC
jgi:hypothetical protein